VPCSTSGRRSDSRCSGSPSARSSTRLRCSRSSAWRSGHATSPGRCSPSPRSWRLYSARSPWSDRTALGEPARAGQRSLQLESLGGAVLHAADRLGIYDAQVVGGSTAALSRDLAGSLPDALALATTLLQVGAVLVVLWLVVRFRVDQERLVAGSAATVAGVLAFAKFISTQYLLWLLPLVPLVLAPSLSPRPRCLPLRWCSGNSGSSTTESCFRSTTSLGWSSPETCCSSPSTVCCLRLFAEARRSHLRPAPSPTRRSRAASPTGSQLSTAPSADRGRRRAGDRPRPTPTHG
jgi:hypothetical protein